MVNRLKDRLIEHFPLNSNPNGVIKNTVGTFTGTEAYTAGPYGRSMASFNGSSSVTVETSGKNLQCLSAITIIAFVNNNSIAGTQRIISRAYGLSPFTNYRLGIASNKWHFQYYNGSGFINLYSLNNATTGKYTHVAVSADSTGIRLYIDGTLDNSASSAFIHPEENETTKIGEDGSVSSQFFAGIIGGIKIYNVSLTADEVAQEYQQSRMVSKFLPVELPKVQRSPMFPDSCVGAWGFNSGSAFKDISGNGNDLTNYGSTLGNRGGFSFNGSSYAKATVANYRSTDEQGTIEFWYKSSNLGGYNTVFSSADESTTSYFFIVRSRGTGNGLEIVCKNNDTTTDFNGTKSINDGVWHHCAISSNGTSYSAMIDGNTETLSGVGTDGRWFADISNRDNISSGALVYSSVATYATAEIRGLAVHSTKLTDDQIKAIYNAGVPEQESTLLLSTTDGAKDNSVYRRTLTPYVATVGGNKMYFNGTSSYVSSSLTLSPTTGSYTFSFWANSSSYSGTVSFIGGSAVNCIQVRNSGLNLQVLDGGSGSGGFATSSSPLMANKWQNIVFTYNAGSNLGTFYVNGSSVGSGSLTPATFSDGLYLWAGGSYNGQYFGGSIADLKVYNEIKPVEWIAAYYESTRKYY